MKRCGWGGANPLMIEYHDTDWGVPVHDDRKLFEFLVLDAFQAGVSWLVVLNKRENFRKAFHAFDYDRVARYGSRELARLLRDSGIVRNRAKILATINNARRFIEVRKEFGTFDRYIWQFVGGKPIRNQFQSIAEIPAISPESEAMSKDMRERGFQFVGPTICYAFMQAVGLVNDHTVDCFRYRQVSRVFKKGAVRARPTDTLSQPQKGGNNAKEKAIE